MHLLRSAHSCGCDALARKSTKAICRPRTRESHAIARRRSARTEPLDDITELDLSIALRESAEARDRDGRRIVDERLAVHAFGDRLDRRPRLLRHRGITDAPLIAKCLLAALAEEERAAGRRRGNIGIQAADDVARDGGGWFAFDRDDPFGTPVDGAEPIGEFLGTHAQEVPDAVGASIDRTEGERNDRAGEVQQLGIHFLMRGRARGEPVQILEPLVQRLLLVLGSGHAVRDAEQATFDDRFARAALDSTEVRRGNCVRRIRSRDRIEIAELAGHSSSSGTSMTTVRSSPCAAADASAASRASCLRYSRTSRRRARSTVSRSVYSSSVTRPSSRSSWSSRSCSRTGSSSVISCSANSTTLSMQYLMPAAGAVIGSARSLNRIIGPTRWPSARAEDGSSRSCRAATGRC